MVNRAAVIVGIILLMVALGVGAYYGNRATQTAGPQVVVTPTPTVLTPTPTPPEGEQTFTGEVETVQASSRAGVRLLRLNTGNNIILNIEVLATTKVTDENRKDTSSTYLKPGFSLRVTGKAAEGGISATTIEVLRAPNIVMTSPTEDEQVNRNFTVRGFARVFENAMQVRVLKPGQTPYINQNIMANSPDTGQYGEFTLNADLRNATDLKSGDTIIVEAFQYSAKDGSETDIISRTVTLR